MSEFIAFLSYSHSNNVHCDGRIVEIANAIQSEVRTLEGNDEFRLLVDREALEWGQFWKTCIDEGVDGSAIFIPVLSPHYLSRDECKREFSRFLEREPALRKTCQIPDKESLILPLQFCDIHDSMDKDGILANCSSRQIVNIESIARRDIDQDDCAVVEFARSCAKRIRAIRVLIDSQESSEPCNDLTNQEIQERFKTFSSGLTSLPSELPDGTWLKRQELNEILAHIEGADFSEQYLIGPPGCGKSSVLKQLAKICDEKKFNVLAIKADKLGVSVNSVNQLAEAILGTKDCLASRLTQLATSAKTILIIDQLDALASLVDLKSGRLNTLLDFISHCRRQKCIHIVASSREYELSVDARLMSIVKSGGMNEPARIIKLGNLKRSQVLDSLAASKVTIENLPEEYLASLENACLLNVFLESNENLNPKSVAPDNKRCSSLLSAHQRLWDLTVEQRDESYSKLLFALAEKIAETESLWQLKESLEVQEQTLAGLIADHWLVLDGDTVSFAHQTQYEYVIAKRFSIDPAKFLLHVIQRQHGLSVRPTVRLTLLYMREMKSDDYIYTFSRLLAVIERRHLKQLLVEFLANVEKPMPSEIRWVFGYLQAPETHDSMCSLLSGKQDWFDALVQYFPALMCQPNLNHWPMTRLLESAWEYAETEVTSLLRDNWAYRAEYHQQLWTVCVSGPSDPETTTWLLWIASSFPLGDWPERDLTDKMLESRPKDAVVVLGKLLLFKLESFLFFQAPEQSEAESSLAAITNFKRPIHNDNYSLTSDIDQIEWYDIDKLADAAGHEMFVNSVWPWLRRMIENCRPLGTDSFKLSTFRVEEIEDNTGYWFGVDDLPRSKILSSLILSIQQFATASPVCFQQFAIANSNLDSRSLQLIVLKGVTAIASDHSDFALSYLKMDDRRMFLGDSMAQQDEVERLLDRAVPSCNEQQLEEFQETVLRWQPVTSVESDDDQIFANRCRVSLLARIPEVQRIDAARVLLAKYKTEVEKQTQAWKEKHCANDPVAEKQVVTSDQLCASTNEQIFEVLKQISVLNLEEGSNVFRISAINGAFEEFAKVECERGVEVFKTLDYSLHGEIAGKIIFGLSRANFDSSDIVDLVHYANENGLKSQHARDDVGRVLANAAVGLKGLSDETCDMLESWLADCIETTEAGKTETDRTKRQNDYAPILYGGGMVPLIFKWFYIGEALKLGLCVREQADVVRWRDNVYRMVDRPFPLKAFEAWIYAENRYCADRNVVAPAFARLLIKKPELLKTRSACMFLANSGDFLSACELQQILTLLAESPDSRCWQASGEISTWIWLRDKNEVCKAFINQRLASLEVETKTTSCTRIGIANSASRFWKRGISKLESTELITQLLKDPAPDLVTAILRNSFSRDSALIDDDETSKLLEAISGAINAQRLRECAGLTHSLGSYATSQPALTLRVCQAVVNAIKETDEGYRINHSLSEGHMVQIALTLHRSSNPKIREKALDLFEDLFDLRAHSAVQGLKELDRRV